MSLIPVPALDQLTADPARVRDLPPEAARELLLRLAPVQEALRLQALGAPAGVNGQPEAPEGDQLLTVAAAASILSFKPAYLYELIRQGEFPVVRQGKYVRIRLSSLSDWMSKHEEKGMNRVRYM